MIVISEEDTYTDKTLVVGSYYQNKGITRLNPMNIVVDRFTYNGMFLD